MKFTTRLVSFGLGALCFGIFVKTFFSDEGFEQKQITLTKVEIGSVLIQSLQHFSSTGGDQWMKDRLRIEYLDFPTNNPADYVDQHMLWSQPYMCQTFLNAIWDILTRKLLPKGYILTSDSASAVQYQVTYLSDLTVRIKHEFKLVKTNSTNVVKNIMVSVTLQKSDDILPEMECSIMTVI